MKYEQDILGLLCEAGDNGLSIKKLAKHVYNMHNTLFESVDFESVYNAVVAFVNKDKRSRTPLLRKTDKWGHYALAYSDNKYSQLMFDFSDVEEEEEDDDAKYVTDKSLSLFD